MDRRLILRVVDSPDRDSPAGLRVTTVSSSALQRVTVGARAAALRAVHSGRSSESEPGPPAVRQHGTERAQCQCLRPWPARQIDELGPAVAAQANPGRTASDHESRTPNPA